MIVIISTETQWSGEIYLKIDFSTSLHYARNDDFIILNYKNS